MRWPALRRTCRRAPSCCTWRRARKTRSASSAASARPSRAEPFRRCRTCAVQPRPESQGPAQWQLRIEREALVDKAHRALHLHIAGKRPQQSGNYADQAGLADAVRADDLAGLARAKLQRKSPKQHAVAAPLDARVFTSATELKVMQGQSVDVPVTVTREPGQTSPLSLNVDGQTVAASCAWRSPFSVRRSLTR